MQNKDYYLPAVFCKNSWKSILWVEKVWGTLVCIFTISRTFYYSTTGHGHYGKFFLILQPQEWKVRFGKDTRVAFYILEFEIKKNTQIMKIMIALILDEYLIADVLVTPGWPDYKNGLPPHYTSFIHTCFLLSLHMPVINDIRQPWDSSCPNRYWPDWQSPLSSRHQWTAVMPWKMFYQLIDRSVISHAFGTSLICSWFSKSAHR